MLPERNHSTPLLLARLAGFLACAIGTGTLIGWAADLPWLVRVAPDFAPMKPNTAIGFLLCGASLLLQCGRDSGWRVQAGRALGAVVAMLGAAVLCEHLTGWNPGLDTWLFREALMADGLPHPGRMTQAAAINFLLLGLALVFLDFEPRRGLRPAQHAALLASLSGLIAVLGYAYGAASLYGVTAYSSMALHTSLTFFLLGIGVMMARPDKALMSVATSPHGGGMMARRLLPAAVLLPSVLGWLRLQGELMGWYGMRFGLALFASSNIITFVLLIWFSARSLNRVDSRRRRAHVAALDSARDLRATNEQLQREIAEHGRTERQLHQSQKMESLGTLAGGIAHDFNNILTVVLLNADRALGQLETDHPARARVEQISRAGGRAAELVRRIMTFSRKAEPDLVTLPLRQPVEDALNLLRVSLPSHIELNADLDAEVPEVAADPTQIHQVILNLGTNAFHAMEARGGTLEVRLDATDLSEADAQSVGDVKPGRHVLLTVRDDGIGMDKNVLERIFDPFFTTKPQGTGTGLGLPVVHGIMRLHGGCVRVQSEPGHGTTFELYFPVAS